MKVYLAGPINGCTDSEANDWRSEAKAWLADTLDPMRRDYRGIEDQNVASIVRNDLEDIRQCGAVLANCPKPSYGTAMEIFFAAYSLRKPVVVIVPEGEAVSPWLRYHSKAVVHTLQDAIRALLA